MEGGQGEREKREKTPRVISWGLALSTIECSRAILNYQGHIDQHTRGFFLGQHRLQGHDSRSLIQLTLKSSRFKLPFR